MDPTANNEPLGGEPLVVEAGEEDLDDFFREKDRRKRERQALKKASKPKAEATSQWMDDQSSDQQVSLGSDQLAGAGSGAAAGGAEVEDLTSEELAARLQAQAALLHRPEDDEWIDTEREFAPVQGLNKKKHRNQVDLGPQDDKLLLLVAPSASKLQDLSEITADKARKEKAKTAATSTAKGWSKPVEQPVQETPLVQSVAGTTAGEAAAAALAVAEPPKHAVEVAVPEPVAAEPAAEPAAAGVYVPRHLRQGQAEAAPQPASRSPRTQSPAARPAGSTSLASSTSAVESSAPAAGAYVPPGRRQFEPAAAPSRPAGSLGSGPSRPAGSGLAASATTKAAVAAKIKIAPDLKSADEFPSLG